MADCGHTATTNTIQGTGAGLKARGASQAGLALGVAILCALAVDTGHDLYPGTGTSCPVQGTPLATTPDSAGVRDALRSLQKHVRTDLKGTLTHSDQFLISASHRIPMLKANLENLQQIRNDLTNVDFDIFDQIEHEIEEADRYTLYFFRASAHLKHWIECLKNKRTSKMKSKFFFSHMAICLKIPWKFLYLFTKTKSDLVKGDGKNLLFTMELGETQMFPVVLKVP